MTIFGLYRYLMERKLFHTESLERLRNSRIAVDGYMWLKGIQQKNENIDPYQIAIGGLPLRYEQILDAEINKFRKLHIIPIFVFNGIDCSVKYNSVLKQRKQKSSQTQLFYRTESWDHYEKGNSTYCKSTFHDYCTRQLFSQPYVHCLYRYFDKNNIEYFVAPFLSWGQMGYFLERKLINGIFGANEILMFRGVRFLITKIVFEEGNFQYLSKKEILSKIDISFEQFIDGCVLAGSYLSETFEAVGAYATSSQTYGISENLFEHAIDMTKQLGNGYKVIKIMLAKNMEDPTSGFYYRHFHDVKTLIRNHVVMTVRGETITKTAHHEVPFDYHNLIGKKLKDELYYLVSQGILRPKLISILDKREYFEEVPIIFTVEIRHLFENQRHLREITFFMLNSLFRLSNEQVDTRELTIFKFGVSKKLKEQIKNYDLFTETHNFVLDGFKFSGEGNILHNIIKYDFKISKGRAIPKYSIDVKVQIMLKFYELIGFIVKKKSVEKENVRKLTDYGKVLSRARYSKHMEQYILLLYLFREGILNSSSFRYNQKMSKRRIFLHVRGEILLITRILSLLPVKFINPDLWIEDIDRDLAAFNCIVSSYYEKFRDLISVIFSYYFVNKQFDNIDLNDLKPIYNSLPFFMEENCIMGLIFKTILLEKEMSFEILEDKYYMLTDVRDHIRDAIKFWEQLKDMVNFLTKLSPQLKQGGKGAIFDQFVKADVFLRENEFLKKNFFKGESKKKKRKGKKEKKRRHGKDKK